MAAPGGPVQAVPDNLGDFSFSLRRSQNGASNRTDEPDDEEALKWAALEKLPTYDRVRTTILSQMKGSKVHQEQVDVQNLGDEHRKNLINRMFAANKTEEDNEVFLDKLQKRLERAGLKLPNVEVRYENITVEAKARVATRSLPTLTNAALNVIEGAFNLVGLSLSKKRKLTILKDVSGIIKPGRMTLLLGPPSSGKTTLLLALAGKLSKSLKFDGKITYNGYGMDEFVPERTSAYISQSDLHVPEMTVRETLDFSARCQGVGDRYNLVTELVRREKEQGILPESDVDLFLKGTSLEKNSTALVTEYTMKILGLDICSDTIIGDEMQRGISGGQKKRVTTGEMTVGPTRTLFMDEISTGLDSSTTYQIVKCMGDVARILSSTVLISLLQPAPEAYNLFDDIILLSEGQIVYHGPRESVLGFFQGFGFKCPQRKGVADFLQEVTSKKDQAQYWVDRDTPYQYVSVPEFAEGFKRFSIGQTTANELAVPFDKNNSHPAALTFQKYSVPRWELFRATFEKERLLMKRNSFIYIFKATQISIVAFITMTMFFRTQMHRRNLADASKYAGALFFGIINIMFNGFAELSMTIVRLPVFYKQRDIHFFPGWAFAITKMILSLPISVLESVIWIALTYYTIGFAPEPGRFFRQLLLYVFTHQMAGGMFRCIAGLCRTTIIANTGGTLALLVIFVLGGFLIPRTSIKPWWIWGYWISPLAYAQNAINVNEYLAPEWGTIGRQFLHNQGSFARGYWFWIGIAAMIGYNILFNFGFVLSITYLNPLGGPEATVKDDEIEDVPAERQLEMQENGGRSPTPADLDGSGKKSGRRSLQKMASRKSFAAARNSSVSNGSVKRSGLSNESPRSSLFVDEMGRSKKGMVLPFKPLAISFNDINYYVDLPAEMKKQGMEGTRLQLLNNITGTFRPSVLTALVGVSGAGKSTLMDVLAGRKTGGYIEGDIHISGFPKQQDTFARISGYCEQTDVHSPQVTVYESVLYSAWLRLPSDVDATTRNLFVEEVMELVELNVIRNALVGLPGVSGLSTEQRKRLTIAVELVANPSIIFMDEPTSGLDARAAAIVMRTVRNTVDTGRTVVCTIHQPSIDIFEAFDELLLMKRGGQVIYAGPLGRHSHKLIEYFEAVEGVPKIAQEYNPAAWMLDVTSPGVEHRLGVDFAEIYQKSPLFERNKALVKEFSVPPPGAEDLWYPTKYAQPFFTQLRACLWKQHWTYWRSPDYNNVRFAFTVAAAVLIGTIFWQLGKKRNKQANLNSILGAMYGAVLFIGFNNANTVQPVVATERTVFYREKAAGLYSPIPYAVAQVLIEVPYNIVQVILYALITYALIGLEWTAAKFFWYMFFMFFTFIYFSYYGMMAVAITPNFQLAAIVSSSLYIVFNLFSGFIIGRPGIPGWWIWYYWICPVSWTIYGIFVSQFGDVTTILEKNDGSTQSVKDFLDSSFGYKHSFLPVVAVVIVIWPVIFGGVFLFGMKFFNFQKR